MPHSTRLIRRASFHTPHSTRLIPHAQFDMPHSIRPIRYAQFDVPRSTCLVRRASFDAPRSTRLVRRASFDAPHSTRLIRRASFVTLCLSSCDGGELRPNASERVEHRVECLTRQLHVDRHHARRDTDTLRRLRNLQTPGLWLLEN